MVLLLAQQSHALGLGEIQVNSYLGEPLRAQVDLTDLSRDYEASLKVRLASAEEYRKGGYPYPYDKRFKFEVVNDDGRHPRVQVTSLYPIDDPFLNLLMEVNSPSGRIIRTFTFLLDPSPDFYRNAVSPQVAPAETAANPAATPVSRTPAAEVARPVKKTQSHTTGTPHKRNERLSTAQRAEGKMTGGPVSGKLSLSLSTSLSISSSDPSLPLSSKDANDALQEELIAKEKTLKDLNEQISEMQLLIKGLQIKLSTSAGSAVAESAVWADSGVSGVSEVSVVSAVEAASAVQLVAVVEVAPVSRIDEWRARIKAHRTAVLSGLMALVLAFAAYYWWRKRKLESGWIPGGLFDDLASAVPVEGAKSVAPSAPVEPPQPAPAVAPPEMNKVATKKLAVGEQSIKVPAFKEQKAPSTLPPEYDLLEEANIYLRFGHDKLAEEVLYDALKINPKNPDTYMTLLGIFDTRTDPQGYERLAKEFKVIADADTWQKVAEMGRKLDIGNALYD